MTPTARTLAECRKRGWRAQVVEAHIPHSFIKRDLFGCIDIIALDGAGILGIQATSGSNVAARVTKMRTECKEAVAEWLKAGGRLAVWGWAKQGPRGGAKRWTLRVVEVK